MRTIAIGALSSLIALSTCLSAKAATLLDMEHGITVSFEDASVAGTSAQVGIFVLGTIVSQPIGEWNVTLFDNANVEVASMGPYHGGSIFSGILEGHPYNLGFSTVSYAGTSGSFVFTPLSDGAFTIETASILFFDSDLNLIKRTDGLITQTSAVPEPSTWAMLLIGFGALGFGAYRRRGSSLSVG